MLTNLKKRLFPPKSHLQKFYDTQRDLLVNAKEYQDWLFKDMEPEPEPDEIDLMKVDTEKILEKLQKVSTLLLYESSRGLEKSTKRLLWITGALTILTLLLILTTTHVI